MSELAFRGTRSGAQRAILLEARAKMLDEEESWAWELYAEQIKDLKGQDYLILEPWYGHELETKLRQIQKLRSGLLTQKLETEYEFDQAVEIKADEQAPHITSEDLSLLLATELGMVWNGYLKLTRNKHEEDYQIMEPRAWRWLQRRLGEIVAQRESLNQASG